MSLTMLAGSIAPAQQRMLSHDVYFTLKAKSPEARIKLPAACKKYSSRHPGTAWFATDMRGEEPPRDVDDVGFEVASPTLSVRLGVWADSGSV
jgi:hypothetical protein